MKATIKSERKNFNHLHRFMLQVVEICEAERAALPATHGILQPTQIQVVKATGNDLNLADMCKLSMIKKLCEKWRPLLRHTSDSIVRKTLNEVEIYVLQIIAGIIRYNLNATLEKAILIDFNTQICLQLI